MDWYVTLPYATGLVVVRDGRVVLTPPIFRWMLGMRWLEAKAEIIRKGGHGEPLEPWDPETEARSAEVRKHSISATDLFKS